MKQCKNFDKNLIALLLVCIVTEVVNLTWPSVVFGTDNLDNTSETMLVKRFTPERVQ